MTQRSPTSSWHTASVTCIVTGIWNEFWQRKKPWVIALSIPQGKYTVCFNFLVWKCQSEILDFWHSFGQCDSVPPVLAMWDHIHQSLSTWCCQCQNGSKWGGGKCECGLSHRVIFMAALDDQTWHDRWLMFDPRQKNQPFLRPSYRNPHVPMLQKDQVFAS